jgi:hypothetical protein
MNLATLQEWQQLSNEQKYQIFEETGNAVGLPGASIEKDWWVVLCLDIIFKSSIATHTVFKGGTSLSKAWGLIDRFSEDIDLALDRAHLGIDSSDTAISNTQVKKIRKLSFQFIAEQFFPEVQKAISATGLEATVQLGAYKNPDTDPLTIEVYYPTVTQEINYIQSKVLIEIGSRSLIEPYTVKNFSSIVGQHFNKRLFADAPIQIPSVNPERTFLEKIFLLHEEFQRPIDQIKIERKSRHLFDLEKLMDTEFANRALNDALLYKTIVQHRSKFTAIRGIDYANHIPTLINPIPPQEIIAAWKNDYKTMQEHMFYNQSLPFDKLIARITELKNKINNLTHNSIF